MVRVARSRNHQNQNAQRPQQRENFRVELHGPPVYELRRRSVLAKGLIVCQPNTTTELTVRAPDEKLVGC